MDRPDRLVSRFKNGFAANTFQRVNYDQMRQLIDSKKRSGVLQVENVKKISDYSKRKKEDQVVRRHKTLWQKEYLKLSKELQRIESDLQNHLEKVNLAVEYSDQLRKFGDVDLTDVLTALKIFSDKLEDDRPKFREATVTPIELLSEDVKFWCNEFFKVNGDLELAKLPPPEAVAELMRQTKEQQAKVIEQLAKRQAKLEADIRKRNLHEVCDETRYCVETGIPQKAFALECFDDELKANLLSEFLNLDDRFQDRMQQLEQQYEDAKKYQRCYKLALRQTGQVPLNAAIGDSFLNSDEFFVISVLSEQYNSEVMENRYTQLLDRLERQLPSWQREDLIALEKFCTAHRIYRERKQMLTERWRKEREDLFNRIIVLLDDAHKELLEKEEKRASTLKQRLICDALRSKIADWRRQREELALLEQREAYVLSQEREEQNRIELEREQARRAKMKEQIGDYRSKRRKEQEEAIEAERRRAAELREALETQSLYDRERVKFRVEKSDEKRKSEVQKQQDRELQQLERERRLEALREKVRPEVDNNMARAIGATECWQQRMFGEEAVAIQKPLYTGTTFNTNQVLADPRVRLEMRLREAGIPMNDYARNMLVALRPAQPDRRNLKANNIFD